MRAQKMTRAKFGIRADGYPFRSSLFLYGDAVTFEFAPGRMHIGSAYYPEHWDESHWAHDIRLMKEAGFTFTVEKPDVEEDFPDH